LTVAFTPAALLHAPPSVLTVAFVMKGKVRAVPLTVVNVTVGAAVFTTTFCAPVVPVFPAVSVCVTVTVYVPLVDSAGDAV
jgi:hypothetical protein